MTTRAHIHYPYQDEPGRYDLDINGDPTEFIADGTFEDMQMFRCIDGRLFAVTFPSPETAKVYELLMVPVREEDLPKCPTQSE